MPGNTIEVEGLGKRYRLGVRPGQSSLREVLSGALTGGRQRDRREVWSLRDLTFDVRAGEGLGVIGRNGAGKSTLLKILARITEPTVGSARTRGRVASLLEVGTGFHPELTGRENVFLNGAILGMARREIAARLDSIVDFAGVEGFVDTPIKRYSSGMHLRLAFAVAAHLEPEILLVDEVLAVGDVEFQRKCLAGMDAVRRDGRTVVFVSHDLEAVARLCPRSLWIDDGRLRRSGPTDDVIDAYLAAATDPREECRTALAAPGGRVIVHRVWASRTDTDDASPLRRDHPFRIHVDLTLTERIHGLDLAVFVTNQRGVRVFDEAWSDGRSPRIEGPGRFVAALTVPPILNVGQYTIGVWLGTAHENFLQVPAVAQFMLDGSTKGRPDRAVELRLPWDVEEIEVGASGTREPVLDLTERPLAMPMIGRSELGPVPHQGERRRA